MGDCWAEGADAVVLGLDAGTTSAKALVVSRAGQVLAEGVSDAIVTRTTADGGNEQDPGDIWRAVTTAGRRAVQALAGDVRVAALAVAAQSGSVIPVLHGDRADRTITWMDERSEPLVNSWAPETVTTIRELSGWAPSSGVGLSTIAWLRSLEAGSGTDRYPAVAKWASVDDYLVFGLTSRWATNPSNAAGMQLMDVSSRTWSTELCRIAGMQTRALSPICEPATVVGGLTSDAASALGLDAGTPVVVGGHDQACAALGLGVTEPGEAFLSAGTAWVLTVVTDSADVGALPPALNLSPHVVPGRWTASENLGGLGAMLAEAPEAAIGSSFESCARSVRDCLEAVAGLAAGGGALTMVGGGIRFDGLADAIADAIGGPVVARGEAPWPAVGAARLAGIALGWTQWDDAA